MDTVTTPRAGRDVLLDERDTFDVGERWDHIARGSESNLKDLQPPRRVRRHVHYVAARRRIADAVSEIWRLSEPWLWTAPSGEIVEMDDVEIDHGAVVRSLALYADALLVVEKLFVLLDAIQLLADVVAALDAAPTDRAVDHHPWDSHEPPGHVASTQPAAHAPPLRNAAPLSAGAAVAA